MIYNIDVADVDVDDDDDIDDYDVVTQYGRCINAQLLKCNEYRLPPLIMAGLALLNDDDDDDVFYDDINIEDFCVASH